MKKRLKQIGIVLVIVLIIIQFFQPTLNANPAFSGHRITDAYKVPENVTDILNTSCYDCHSNTTRPMFYMHVQPVGWWIMDHINEGKEELNFDEFGTYSLRRQYHKLEEIMEQVNEDEMPLTSYTLVHGDAKLSDTQKQTLVDWADALRDTMEAHYPMDSLVRKQ